MLTIDVMDDSSAGNWSVSEMNQEILHLQKAINNTAGKAVRGHIRPALSFHDKKPMDGKKDFASIALFGDELVDPHMLK